MSWRWASQNTFEMWTVLYWTRSSRTQFGVSIHIWRLAGDTLNITCNFLYCCHQMHRDFSITLYFWHISKLHHTCTCNRLPEDERSSSMHVEHTVKIKYYFTEYAFCWFILHKHSATRAILQTRNTFQLTFIFHWIKWAQGIARSSPLYCTHAHKSTYVCVFSLYRKIRNSWPISTKLVTKFIWNILYRMSFVRQRLQKKGRWEKHMSLYEGWNFNSGNYLFTSDTK